jgi:hypothetical protein
MKFVIRSKNDSNIYVTGCNSIEKDGLNWASLEELPDPNSVKSFELREDAEGFNATYNNAGEVVPLPLLPHNIQAVKIGQVYAAENKQKVTCTVYENWPAAGDGYTEDFYFSPEEIEDALKPADAREWDDSIEDMICREINAARA